MGLGLVSKQNNRILIVEDTESKYLELVTLLGDAGYRVRSLVEGVTAQASVQADLPDLILLSFTLTGHHGLDLCSTISTNSESKDIPIIFITTSDETDLKTEALAAGAVDFIAMPFESPEVLARIGAHLSLSRAKLALKEQTNQFDAEKLSRIESESRLSKCEMIVNTSCAVIVGLDIHHKVQLFNRGAEYITGYSASEVLGQDWFKLFVSPDILDEIGEVWKNSWGISSHSYVNPILTKQGKERIISWQTTGLYEDEDESKHLLISIGEDITKQVQAEADVKNMEAHLRHQQKLEAIGTLASGIAHEINNPINGIMNYGQLIYNHLADDNPLFEYASGILHETKRIAEIVHNLLNFSRHDKGTYSLVCINDVINETLSLMKAMMRHDEINLKLDVPEDLPQLRCSSQQIRQVLMNLVTNARDALNERYPGFVEDKNLLIRVRSFEEDCESWLRITVEDHGSGIADDIRDRIYDPFFTTKGRSQGTGLGLWISHGIVKEHKGKMTMESNEGEPTRFHIDLRLDP